jgi:hypothetical protein
MSLNCFPSVLLQILEKRDTLTKSIKRVAGLSGKFCGIVEKSSNHAKSKLTESKEKEDTRLSDL